MNYIKRMIAMLVAFVMMVTSVSNVFCITATAADTSDAAGSRAATDTRIADATTLDGWKQYFGDSDTDFNTQYAGHVWTDKSVTTDASNFNYATDGSNNSIVLNSGQNNFLVSLSAMASSKSITGQDNKPTDTMIVLDLSSSMYDGANRATATVKAMVDSVNSIIKNLQELNVNNRVGVTIYYGGVDRNQSTAPSYQLLLPLDRYVHSSDKFLRYTTSSGSKLKTVGVNTNVKNENGKTVSASRTVTDVAGTYTQQGILSALDQFLKADTTVPETAAVNAGETRVPVMVLMSDGEPTAATHQYTNIEADAGMGNNTVSIRYPDETDFVTQLTASYAKEMMDAHYEEDPLFYTLSLGTNISYDVMDPSDTLGKNFTQSATISGYWDKLITNGWVKITVKNSPDGWRDPSVTKEYTVERTTVTGKTLSSAEVFPSSKSQQLYVDKAFEAATASDLANAFNNIFADISLQTHTYPTLIEDDENLSGYVSFVDKIGKYMNVTDVKGILLGNHWYSGKELSKNFVPGGGALGTADNPSALGDELVWSIQQRLGLDNSADVRTLLSLAYQHKQLAYNSDGSYSNYVGWYSDAQGNYLGFWRDGLTTAPANATHTNKSYIYLGETDDSHGVKNSDMMYTTVRVRHEIATGVKSVSFAVPAALIPTVEFDIEYDENDNLTSVKRSGADHPIRLVYEVALDDSINERTICDVVDADYIKENTDADGYVNFYTNQYEVDGTVGYGKVNTYSYFRPSHQNENYYYQVNSPVYADQYGTIYNGDKLDPNGTFYREITVFSKTGSTIEAKNIYRKLSSAALDTATSKGDGTWYIPKGNVHVNLDGYTIAKTVNETDTLINANYPYVDVYGHNVNDTNHSFVIGDTLGNNGKVRIKPETGIKITKTIEEATAATNMDKEFEFTIETDTSVTGEYDTIKIAADGTATAAKATFNNGKATVTLKHGESIYVLGLTPELKFTITETEEKDFVVSKVVMDGKTISETVASGTLDNGYIADVEFTNAPRGKGTLTIAKQVVHSLGTDYQIPSGKTFSINVKLEGVAVNVGATFDVIHSGDETLKNVTLGDNNLFTLTLKHGDQVEITGIPEGTKATVTETVTEENPGKGFTVTYKENGTGGDGVIESIKKAPTIDYITVVNTYTPDQVEVKIDLSGVKTLLDKDRNTINPENWAEDLEFQFIIQKYVLQDNQWQWVNTEDIDTVNKSDNTIDFAIDGRELIFDKVGVYGYQVIEKNHGLTVNGIAYDDTMHTFDVIVTDNDMDGKLEAEVRSSHGEANSFTFTDNVWTNNQINFTNKDNRGETSQLIMIKKNLTNESGSTAVSLEGYQFELYKSDENYETIGNEPVLLTPATDAAGETYVYLEYEYNQAGTYYYKLKEKPTGISRMTDSGEVYNFKVTVTVNPDDSVTSELVAGKDTTFGIFDGGQGVTYKLATFTNKYTPDPATVTLNVSKELNGRTLKEGEFEFNLNEVGKTEPIQTVANDVNGKVQFAELTFNKVGIYEYTVTEVIPGENEKLLGVTYDETVYDIIITVKDGKDSEGILTGKLEATVEVLTIPGTDIVFKNDYQPSEAKEVLRGTKTLEGKELIGGMFTFTLAESDSEGNVKENGYSQKVTNDENGNFTFSELTYNANGTHYYVVSEDIPENTQGIEYATVKYLVKIDVAYNTETGVYDISKTLTKLENTDGVVDEIKFENRYEATPTTAVISGIKVLQGRDLAAEQFEFKLYSADDNWTKAKELQTVKNDEEGSFTFEDIEFKQAGTYRYIVSEVNASAAGYTYDAKEVGVIITVTDGLKGSLDATQEYVVLENTGGTVTEKTAAVIGFENHYVIKEDVKVNLYGEKSLTGKDLNEGDFTFVLTDVTDAANPVEVARVKNDAQGKFAFELTYTATDMNQTHTYMIKEIIPDNKEGIVYDENSYTVTVKVIDNGDGTLGAKTFVGANEVDQVLVKFENKYNPDVASAVIKGEKNLKGRSLKAEEFEFSLIKDGTVVETVKNNADGTFTFSALTFDKAGTYKYTVVENDTKAERITYDKTEYKIVINVLDESGFLEAKITVLDDGDEAELEFNNEYTPENPIDPGPFTGDNSNTGMYLILLVCSFLAIVGIVFYRRKRG